MLVLSRKKNESIVIDDKITIIIVDIRGDKVRLGIDAPKDVTVHRQEVFEAIQESETQLPREGVSNEEGISNEKGVSNEEHGRKAKTGRKGSRSSTAKANDVSKNSTRTPKKEVKELVSE